MNTLIIDSHCHYGPGTGLVGPWDTRASLQKFMRWSKEAGIHQTVLFAAFSNDYSKGNEIVAELVNKYPDKFFGYAFLHAENDKGRIYKMVHKAVNLYNFKGIKVHRADARISREICEVARHFSLPVLYDVLGEVTAAELLATEFPEVNFIIPHLGSFGDDWKAQLSFIDFLARHPNIYTDTSGIKRFDLLEMAYQRAGAHKILFGTDGPWLHPLVELAKITALKPTVRNRELMLHKNFLRLIASVTKRE